MTPNMSSKLNGSLYVWHYSSRAGFTKKQNGNKYNKSVLCNIFWIDKAIWVGDGIKQLLGAENLGEATTWKEEQETGQQRQSEHMRFHNDLST